MGKKIYLVFDGEHGHIRGTIDNDEILNIFKEQRDISKYRIQKVSVKKVEKLLKSQYMDISVLYGILLFPSEEEYYNESFDQMLTDMEYTVDRMVRRILPILKLTEEEYDIVFNFLRDFYTACSFLENEDEESDIDPALVFKIPEMIKFIIDNLGG